jgi:hypothetical protein
MISYAGPEAPDQLCRHPHREEPLCLCMLIPTFSRWREGPGS